MTNHIVDEGRMDAAASAATSAALAAGETFHGYLDGRDDSDWIRVELTAGASYMITVAPRDPDGAGDAQKAAADTALEIRDVAGDVVVSKDDLSQADRARHPNADAMHPIVTFEPEATGVYYLSVSSYNEVAAADNSGGYALKLVALPAPPDPNRDLELTGTAGADKLEGAGGEDTIKGGAGADFLRGGGANDELFGEGGDDTLEGGPGADTLSGGFPNGGVDTITYARSTAAVRVNLGEATAEGGEADGDVIMHIENIIGSPWDDWLRGDSNDNILTGGAGDDTLIGGGGGRDTLSGGAGDDTLNGGAGDDMLTGGAGADTITGGPGADTISYAGSDSAVDIRLRTGHASGGHAEGDVYRDVEHVTGSAHNDRLAGDDRPAGEDAGGDNTLRGGGGADEIYGGSGDDTLHGEAGDDALFGGVGDDRLDGGAGDDTLHGGAGADSFIGGAGEDTISYEYATDEKIRVGLTNDREAFGRLGADANNPSHSDGDHFPNVDVENVIGSPRGDTIQGSGVANKLWGGAGADTIIGHGGDDTIDGGPGGDIIDGDADPNLIVGLSLVGTAGTGDTVTYANSDAGVRVTASSIGTPSTGNEGGHAEGDRLRNIENLIGSAHDDRLFGDAADNELSGGDGDDRIEGRGSDDTVEGGAGADTLDGGQGTDSYLAVQFNNDVLSYASSTGGVTIDLSRQYLPTATAEQQRGHFAAGSGGDASGDKFRGFEHVTGGMGNDRLTGDGWNNILIGGPGADVLDGGNAVTGAGADGQFGTADDVSTSGFDTASYAGSSAGVTITFSMRRSNNEDVHIGAGLGGDAAGDRLLNIDRVVGSAHDDRFFASNLTQQFDGGENAMDDPMTPNVDESKDTDTLSYERLPAALGGVTITLSNIENFIGSQGDDDVTGTAEPNRIETGAGADTLNGGAGEDILDGGAGADTLTGGPDDGSAEDGVVVDGNDLIIGGGGADILNGGGHVHAIDGRDGRPHLAHETAVIAFWPTSTAGTVDVTDPTRGYDGDTLSYAGSNIGVDVTLANVAVNNRGPDLDYGASNRQQSFGDNFSVLFFTAETGSRGHAAGDTINGSIENLIGSDHSDFLTGNRGSNAIAGGKGDDILTGNGAADDIFGDVFIFAPGDGVDSIEDFNLVASGTITPAARAFYPNRADRIDVRAFDFDTEGVTTLAQLAERNEGFSVEVMDLDNDGTEDDTLVSLPGDGEIHLHDVTGLGFHHFVFELV